MKRRHLPELEDETWFPTFLRDYGTDYLQFLVNATGFYKDLVPTMQRGLAKAKQKVVVDIAAGGGGGWKKLGPDLKAAEPDVKVILTDFFPNLTCPRICKVCARNSFRSTISGPRMPPRFCRMQWIANRRY